MATKESADFDPRFDPAFQRGFGGGPLSDTPARAVPRSPAPAQIGSPPAAPMPVVGDGGIHEDKSGQDAAADADDRRGINPFLVALTVASVLLIAGGLWGVQAAREPFLQTDAAAQADYVGLQLLIAFAPLAIILGIATGLGVLFFLAAAWQRGRR